MNNNVLRDSGGGGWFQEVKHDSEIERGRIRFLLGVHVGREIVIHAAEDGDTLLCLSDIVS